MRSNVLICVMVMVGLGLCLGYLDHSQEVKCPDLCLGHGRQVKGRDVYLDQWA